MSTSKDTSTIVEQDEKVCPGTVARLKSNFAKLTDVLPTRKKLFNKHKGILQIKLKSKYRRVALISTPS